MTKKRKNNLPRGWTEEKVRRILAHYESQTDEEAAGEDEAAFRKAHTVMRVPAKLVPVVRQLIARHQREGRRR